MTNRMGYYTEPVFPKLLPDIDPHMRPPSGMTLVLSLEDLMVFSEWTREQGWRTAKRPGLDYFLRYLSQYYELVVFTTLPMYTADPIIQKLDPFRIITWPLFREATRYDKGDHVKDLSYLNRDLSKVIMIDTNPAHAKLQPENSIIIPPWKGTSGDKGLVELIPFLEYAATMNVGDVRRFMASFNGCKSIPEEFARREAVARKIFNEQMAEEKRKKERRRGGFSSIASALGMKPIPGLGVPPASGLSSHDESSLGGAGLAALMPIPGEPSVMEGFEQGKMLSDQIRERGIRVYEQMDKEIRENGEKWLKEMEAEQKRAQEEQMKSMKTGMMGMVFGAGPDAGASALSSSSPSSSPAAPATPSA